MNITKEKFLKHVGFEPENDDLERCNCKEAGQWGHKDCGWSNTTNMPMFMGESATPHYLRKLIIKDK